MPVKTGIDLTPRKLAKYLAIDLSDVPVRNPTQVKSYGEEKTATKRLPRGGVGSRGRKVQSQLNGDQDSGVSSDTNDEVDILKHFRPSHLPSRAPARPTPAPATHQDRTSRHRKIEDTVVPHPRSRKHTNGTSDDDMVQVIEKPRASLTPNFSLMVPIRPSPSPRKGTQPSPIPNKVHQTSPPLLKSNLQVVVPRLETKEQLATKKAQVFEELKRDAKFAQEHQDVVQRYFGSNGFSEAFSVNDLAKKMDSTTIFLREVPHRSRVPLDFGTFESPAPRKDKFGNPKRIPSLRPEQMVKLLLDERFEAYNTLPTLTFDNNIDDRHISGRFQFVDEYIFRHNVKPVDTHKNNPGCDCGEECNPSKCGCLYKTVTTAAGKNEKEIRKTYRQHSTIPDLIVLHEDYIANEMTPELQHYEITECNEHCGCGPNCWNRVVTRGRTVPLEIYMTERCGFGVRSSIDIQEGQFIDLYLGELITQRELEAREAIQSDTASSYIYSLDWFDTTPIYHVDGTEFGSAMRFVNHCCSPNARSFACQIHKGDKRVYNLAFFAIRDIPAGEQITIDYIPQSTAATESVIEDTDMYGAMPPPPPSQQLADVDLNAAAASTVPPQIQESVSEEDKVKELDEDLVRCECGAPNCRKYLWPKTQNRRRKRKKLRIADH